MPDLRLRPIEEDMDVAPTLPFPVDGARMLRKPSISDHANFDATQDIVSMVDDAMNRLQEKVEEVSRGLDELHESYQFPFDDDDPPAAA